MTADEETVRRVREFLKLHYETRQRLVVIAEVNHERARRGMAELESGRCEIEKPN